MTWRFREGRPDIQLADRVTPPRARHTARAPPPKMQPMQPPWLPGLRASLARPLGSATAPDERLLGKELLQYGLAT